MQYIFKKENINPKLMDSLVYWMVGATIIGARLGHVIFYDWGYYKEHLGEIFMVHHPMVFSKQCLLKMPEAVY